MRKLLLLSALGFTLLGVRVASALPCCSICDVDPPPKFCRSGCLPNCVADEAAPVGIVYDEAAGVCRLG